MLRLTSILYAVIGTTLAGAGVVVALTMNLYDVQSILIGAALGALGAVPVSWIVARKLQGI
jgi:hypothetical protein